MTSRLIAKNDSRGYLLSSLTPRSLSMDSRGYGNEPDYPLSCSAQSITGSISSLMGHGWLAKLGQPPHRAVA